jgi:hypothetical protein
LKSTRLPLRSALLAVVASLAIATNVFAASRTTNVLNVWGTVGLWGGYTNFFADWQVQQWHSEQRTTWLVDHFEMSAVVQNGKNCDPSYCTEWSFGAVASFQNSLGQQITSLAPPTLQCYSASYSSNSKFFAKCGWTLGRELPLSVTKVRLTWTVSVLRPNGTWVNAWGATKTVSLT